MNVSIINQDLIKIEDMSHKRMETIMTRFPEIESAEIHSRVGHTEEKAYYTISGITLDLTLDLYVGTDDLSEKMDVQASPVVTNDYLVIPMHGEPMMCEHDTSKNICVYQDDNNEECPTCCKTNEDDPCRCTSCSVTQLKTTLAGYRFDDGKLYELAGPNDSSASAAGTEGTPIISDNKMYWSVLADPALRILNTTSFKDISSYSIVQNVINSSCDSSPVMVTDPNDTDKNLIIFGTINTPGTRSCNSVTTQIDGTNPEGFDPDCGALFAVHDDEKITNDDKIPYRASSRNSELLKYGDEEKVYRSWVSVGLTSDGESFFVGGSPSYYGFSFTNTVCVHEDDCKSNTEDKSVYYCLQKDTTPGSKKYCARASDIDGDHNLDGQPDVHGACAVYRMSLDLKNIYGVDDPGEPGCNGAADPNEDALAGEIVIDKTNHRAWAQWTTASEIRNEDDDEIGDFITYVRAYQTDPSDTSVFETLCSFEFNTDYGGTDWDSVNYSIANYYQGPTIDQDGNVYVIFHHFEQRELEYGGRENVKITSLYQLNISQLKDKTECNKNEVISFESNDEFAQHSPVLVSSASMEFILVAVGTNLYFVPRPAPNTYSEPHSLDDIPLTVQLLDNGQSSTRVTSSPVMHDGKIYIVNEAGAISVIEAYIDNGQFVYEKVDQYGDRGQALWPRYRRNNQGNANTSWGDL